MRKIFKLLLILSSIWYLDRWWTRRFETVDVTPIDIDGQAGRRLVVRSILPKPPAFVWERVKTPQLLQHIAYPLLTFARSDGREMASTWTVGDTVPLQLYGLTFFPLGRHDIHLAWVDERQRALLTHESGTLARTWNHLITVAPLGNDQTLYTDQIDIEAGPLTPFIVAFARVFYRYRQMRWQQLANSR